jgi:peptide/nickel transport system permease protein
MLTYIIKRVLLLIPTLFCIVLVNFVIINMAPGDPVTVTDITPEGGASRRENQSMAFGSDERYLQFREHYGLTLPILFNTWPWITKAEVEENLKKLLTRKAGPNAAEEMPTKEYNALRVNMGDQARFIMPILLGVIEDTKAPLTERILASQLFARGGTQQAFLGADITSDQQTFNQRIATDNQKLRELTLSTSDTKEATAKKIKTLTTWYKGHQELYHYQPTLGEKIHSFFFETRFFRYLSRVLTLDFGTLRNDDNKTVVHEVTRRFKYSLTLSVTPMILTFFLCFFFGVIMAYNQNRWIDRTLNLTFLILYAIPIFVVAPFLIEKVALNGHFPFTNTPIPISGFTSPESIYEKLTSSQRLLDVIKHIFLPIVAIMYGSLAVQSRLARTAVLEVLRQDYIRTAKAKGVSQMQLLFKHVGRNAAITLVTSIAGSLGVILGGSLIVEMLFEINGFGKFFYDAVINRDYNVIMFSTLAGSFLTLMGYLVADIAYTILDPRITLD